MDLTTIRRPEPVDAAPSAPTGQAVRRPGLLGASAAAATGLAVLAVVTVWTGDADPSVLVDPGALTRWGLPAARAVHDVTAMATVGVLVVAVVLLPPVAGRLGPDATRLVRLATRWSTAWVVAALAGALLTLSDAAGRPVHEVLSPGVLPLALDLPPTRALLSSAWLAAVVVLWSRWTRTPAAGVLLLLLSGAALLPTLLTAHAGHDRVGVVSLVVHVAAASVWCGGLLALALHLRSRLPALVVALPRYSRVALACFVLVAASGLLTAYTLLESPSDLVGTTYGRLVLAKLAALLVLGALGHRHRGRTLAGVAAGRPRAFLALAAVEVAVMAATVGLAVGLARTATPEPAPHDVAVEAAAPVVTDASDA